ncbi:hypothetical protein [Roseomonas elaeocarpi]|uniref:Antifreeze protein n=1 Tax=Roseomonas elaeocarpi TaxID=907779 RepID=A0ABV6JQ14_9PROT
MRPRVTVGLPDLLPKAMTQPLEYAAEIGRWNLFAWQTGWVFTLRSAQLWAEPATAATSLNAMAAEKQRAFLDGWAAAGRAAIGGAGVQAVTEAAMRPARRRVIANLRQLRRAPRR